MDQRIARVLAQVPGDTLAAVAAGALGNKTARLDGPPSFVEIKRPHAEERTIGIVRASGTAEGRDWSSVIKLVDLAIPGADRVAGLTWPEYEELVYERRLFTNEGMRFRPARCYAVTRPEEQLKLIWLEDLSYARGTPFSIDEVGRMALHLGEWNGRHWGTLPDVGFPLGRDAYVHRVRGWNYPKRIAELSAHSDHPLVRATYPNASFEMPLRLMEVIDRLLKRLLSAPHSFAFGDISVGNIFSLPAETVAIDWASLTVDPAGVDGGCLVGSSLTWGPEFMRTVRAERELWQLYVDGLKLGGWHGELDDLRRAALAQIGSYFLAMAVTPVLLATGNDWMREFIEGRFGLPAEGVCGRLADAVAMIPAYVDEIEDQLAG